MERPFLDRVRRSIHIEQKAGFLPPSPPTTVRTVPNTAVLFERAVPFMTKGSVFSLHAESV
jgi:hypothetical protein